MHSIPHKRPFQDITDQFVSPIPPTPPARPRRKPKTPGGALGAKLRLHAQDATGPTTSRANVFPSSLPPSSPPLASSSARGFPVLGSEDEVANTVRRAWGRSDFESMPASDADAYAYAYADEEDADDDAENRAPSSDPFGFFAAERKLKAVRATHPPPLVPSASSQPTPSEAGDTAPAHTMPATPHKPKPGTGVPPPRTGADVFSPTTESLPSSPSPVKGTGNGTVDLEMDAREGVDAGMRRELFPPRGGESNGDAPPPSKRRRQSPEMSDPPMPPRRSTRTRSKPASSVASKAQKQAAPTKAKAKGKAKEKESGSDDEENDENMPPPTRRSTRTRSEAVKPQKRPRKAPAKSKAPKVDDDDDDQQEIFALERQARIEYFKKLDDYSFEKETVYVV